VEPLHSYCVTAKIIRTQSIFCERCKEPYKLFIKEEKMCSNKLSKLLALYFVVLICAIAIAIGILILDGHLKKSFVNKHPDLLTNLTLSNTFTLSHYRSINQTTTAQTNQIDLWDAVRWDILAPVSIVMIIILTWCLVFTFQEELQNRKKLIYIDTKPRNEDLTRT